MQEHEPRCCFGNATAHSPNCHNHTVLCHDWSPTGPSFHPTKLDLDENTLHNDSLFGEAHDGHDLSLAEPPIKTIDAESEAKSELNSNHQSPGNHHDPDCQFPSDLLELQL